MANFSDKADEVVGRAKQAAGDLTGNDELHAEGTVEKASAQVKQSVDAASDKAAEVKDKAVDKAAEVKDDVSELADKASEQVSHVADKAVDTAEQLHLDDKRVLVVAAIAGITLTLLLRNVRARRNGRAAVTKRSAKRTAKRATKRAAKSGLARALSS